MAATKGTKKTTKTTVKKPTAKQLELQQKARRELLAIIMFALGILLFFMTLIRGQNVWQWFHNLLLGFFGWSVARKEVFQKRMAQYERKRKNKLLKAFCTILSVVMLLS